MKFTYDKNEILNLFWEKFNTDTEHTSFKDKAIDAFSSAVVSVCFDTEHDAVSKWIGNFWGNFIKRTMEELFTQFGSPFDTANDSSESLDLFLFNILVVCDCQLRFFTRGYCYHFAAMLKSVFPKGRILKYHGHMVFYLNGSCYDATGYKLDTGLKSLSKDLVPLKYVGNELLSYYKRLQPLVKVGTPQYRRTKELEERLKAKQNKIKFL